MKGENVMDITELTVHELQEKLKNKELTVTEITKAYVDRINDKEKDISFNISNLLPSQLSFHFKVKAVHFAHFR